MTMRVKGIQKPKKPDRTICEVCGVKLIGHPLCLGCGMLYGAKHLAEDQGGGLCQYCTSPKPAEDYDLEGVLKLIAAVLQAGETTTTTPIEIINPRYYLGPCGRWWANLAGLSPQALWDVGTRRTGLAGHPYTETQRCYTCRR